MVTERQPENELPNEELYGVAEDLLKIATDALKENEGLKSAITRKFFRNPQGHGIEFKPGQIEFESKGTDFVLTLDRDVISERLILSTKSEGVEEHISICLDYKEKPLASSGHGGITRGDPDKVILAFRETNWHGDKPSEQHYNNSIAIENIRQFLQQI